MAAKGYSAGRVFLQVVPSYRNFMESLRKDARGPLGKAIADVFEKEMEKAGVQSGEKAGKALTKSITENVRVDALTADLKKKLGKALDDVGDDTSTFGRKLIALQRDIEKTGKVTADHIKQQRALSREMLAASEAATDEAKAQRLLSAAGNLDPNTPKQYAAAQREVARETAAAGRAAAQAEREEKRRNKTMRDGSRDTNVAARGLDRLRRMLAGVRGDSQDGANAFRFFNFAILGAASLGAGLIPILAGVGGGMALLGPIIGGLGAGLGVAALGFSGVGDAVKAMSQQQDAAASSSSGYSRNLVSAARAVADARRSLKDAYRNSAEGIERAVESQADAERSLADAQRDARDAQRDLTQARKEAKAEQADLANQVAQNQLDERQGVIDLFNAYNTYGAVMADGGSTNLEREQADIALKQAELNLKRIREEEKRLADQKKKSDKQGIDGSDRVRDATRRLTDAIERQRDAQRRLERATRDVSRARADGARTIADAQRALTRAQEDYNFALQGGAEAVDKVEQAMSKLSPAAQRFARYLFSLRKGLKELRDLAAAGMLPGVEDAMRRIIDTYGPGMKSFVRDMSGDLGDLAVQAGETFTNPVWRDFFSDMREASRQFTRDATQGTLGFMTGFVAIMDEALPSSRKLSTYVKEIGERFGLWAASDRGRERIREFFDYVDRIGPKVKDFFVAFAGAVESVAVAFAPIGESILTALTKMFDSISKMDEAKIRQIGVGLAIIVIALQSAAGIMAVISLAAAIATAPLLILVGAAAGLAAAFLLLGNSSEKNKKFFTDLMDTLKPLTDAARDLWKMFKDNLVDVWENALLPALKDITRALKKDLLPAFKRFWPVIRPLVGFIVKLFGVILKGAIMGARDLILGIIKVLTGVMDFITGVFTGDWSMAWDGIKKIFFGIIQGIWGFINLWFFGKILGGFKAIFKHDIPGILRNAGKLILYVAKHPFRLIMAFFKLWRKGVTLGFQTAMKVIRGIFDGFKTVKNKVVGWMGDLKDLSLKAVRGLRDGIKEAFKKIRGYIGKPLLAVVDFVINKALIGGINTLLKWVGIKGKDGKGKLGTIPLPKGDEWKASGGVLPGYTPGKDVHHFVSPTAGRLHLSGGEAIMRPEWTKAVGGARAVAAMNAAAIKGKAFAKGGIFWPTTTKQLSGDYPGHTGVDISGPGIMGKPVFAAQAGIVSAAKRLATSYGIHARIMGVDGIESIYAHMSKMMVRAGQIVKAGTQIGNVGSTGNSTGPHLHFEVRPGGTRGAALAYLNNGKIPKGGQVGGKDSKADSLSASATRALKDPFSWLSKRVVGGMEKVGGIGGGMADFVKRIPGKLLSGVANKIKDLAMKALDVGKDWFKKSGKNGRFSAGLRGFGGKGPALYDNGGYLPPGLSMVMNKTSKPEPVLTSDQWDRILAARGGGSGETWNITGNGADPEALARYLVEKLRFEQRKARRSGTLGAKVAG